MPAGAGAVVPEQVVLEWAAVVPGWAAAEWAAVVPEWQVPVPVPERERAPAVEPVART